MKDQSATYTKEELTILSSACLAIRDTVLITKGKEMTLQKWLLPHAVDNYITSSGIDPDIQAKIKNKVYQLLAGEGE